MKNQVFYKVGKKQTPGLTIADMLGVSVVKGDIGIEIECEGNKLQKKELPPPWTYCKDGSLRGHDNAEYVYKGPQPFDKVEKSMDNLWAMFDSYGTKLDESNRTSLHVHMNVQSFYLDRLTCFLSLFFIMEDILTHYAGDHRVGNLFCLNAKDAPGIIMSVKKYIQSDGATEFHDGMHYAGVNCSAIHKFGSVEFRHFRGPTKKQEVLDWVRILQRLYELSDTYDDPRQVCVGFSSDGPIAFLQNILGPEYNNVIEGCGMSQDDIMTSLYQGIRIAQELCFCRDWRDFEKIKLASDPFGRKASKVIKSIEANEQVDPYLKPQVSASPTKKASSSLLAAALKASQPTSSQWAPTSAQDVQDLHAMALAKMKNKVKPSLGSIYDEITNMENLFKPYGG